MYKLLLRCPEGHERVVKLSEEEYNKCIGWGDCPICQNYEEVIKEEKI